MYQDLDFHLIDYLLKQMIFILMKGNVHVQCNKLEDEYHFVLECMSYNDLRKQLSPVYYWNEQIYINLQN